MIRIFENLQHRKKTSISLVFTLIIFGFVFTPSVSVSQSEGTSGRRPNKKLEDKLEVCELYYDDGDYAKALSKAEALFKTYKRKGLGYAATKIQARIIRYKEAVGDYIGFEEAVETYLKMKAQRGENSPAYGHGLLHVAEAYTEYSYYSKAEEYLKKAKIVLEDRPAEKHLLEKVLAVEAKIALARGQYDLFDGLAEEWKGAFSDAAGSSETYFDDEVNGSYTKSLSSRGKLRRKNAYAEILTLKGEAFRRAGKFSEAERALRSADSWINGNLNTRSLAYVRNLHTQNLLNIDRGKKRGELKKSLEKNLYRAERILGRVHKEYLKLHESLIDFYIAPNFLSRSSLGTLSLGDSDKEVSLTQNLLSRLISKTRTLRKNRKSNWDFDKNTTTYYGKERLQHALAVRAQSRREFRDGNLEKAERELTTIYENTEKVPPTHVERSRLLEDLYAVKTALNKPEEAEAVLKELISIQNEILGKNSLSYSLAKTILAEHYTLYTGKLSTADSLYTIHRAPILEQTEAHQHNNLNLNTQLAEYHKAKDNYDSVRFFVEKNLQAVEEAYGKDHIRYAVELRKMGELQIREAKLEEANETIEQALKIFESQSHWTLSSEFAHMLETAAGYNVLMGEFKTARSMMLRAELLNKRSNQSIANSSNADNLAFLYIQTGRFDEAKEILESAISIREERYGPNSAFLITPYTQIARLSLLLGDYIKADESIRKAYKISEELYGENSLRTAEVVEVQAEISTAIADYENAKVQINKAVTVKEEALGRNNLAMANTLTQLALIKFYDDEPIEDVENLLLESEGIILDKLGSQNPIYAEFLKKTALIYLRNGDAAKADRNLQKAYGVWETLEGKHGVNKAEIRTLRAQVYTVNGRYFEAEEAYKISQKDYKKIFNKEHPSYMRTMGGLARVYFASGDLKKSEKYIQEVIDYHKNYIKENFTALSDREKTNVWNTMREDFEFYNNLAIRLKVKENDGRLLAKMYNNVLLTKPLLISSSAKTRNRILNSTDDSLRNTYQYWIDTKEEILKVQGYSQEQLKELDIDLRDLKNREEELAKQLGRMSSDLFVDEEKLTGWEEVRDAVPSDAVCIELVRYLEFKNDFTDTVRYAALVLEKSSKTPQLIINPIGNDLETKFIRYYTYTMEQSIEDLYSYDKFWKVFEDKLPEGKRVFLSVDGVYSQINPESIRTEGEEFLIDKRTIVLLSSSKDLLETQAKRPTAKGEGAIVLMGNPDFSGGLDGPSSVVPLPGAEEEVKQISKTVLSSNNVDHELMIGKEATEERVRELKSPRVLHMATHGFFVSDADFESSQLQSNSAFASPLLRSGLLLTNAAKLLKNSNIFEYNKEPGILTALEVMNQDFEGTELIILSACETGKGDLKVGEGVYGLQRAFLVAGANNIIMSLFKVSDAATQKLLLYFYDNWQNKNMKKTDAFREAKIQLREEFSDPIYWGAFVLIGHDE